MFVFELSGCGFKSRRSQLSYSIFVSFNSLYLSNRKWFIDFADFADPETSRNTLWISCKNMKKSNRLCFRKFYLPKLTKKKKRIILLKAPKRSEVLMISTWLWNVDEAKKEINVDLLILTGLPFWLLRSWDLFSFYSINIKGS